MFDHYNDRYIAMIKRVHENWEINNDLQKKVTKLNRKDTKENSHFVVFIKK